MRRITHRAVSHRAFMVLAGAILVGGMVTASLPASAKSSGSPKLTIKPSKNLTNGETVMVSGKGFTPGDSVYVLECVLGETSTSGSGCNIGGLVGPETISSKGVLPTVSFTVETGAIGTQGGTCGTTSSNAKACDISAGNPSGGDSTETPIAFKVAK